MGTGEQLAGKKMETFRFVDVHRITREGKPTKWGRIPITKLIEWRDSAIAQESKHIYCTVQRFSNKEATDGEDYICPLYFDFDSDEVLGESLNDVRKLIHYLDDFGIEEGVDFYYTGNRGFHVTIDFPLFDAVPSNNLVRIWRHAAEGIAKKLELKTFDRTVYSKRRMWRMENTQHGKTGLWKIRLYPTELNLSVDEIKALAIVPREVGNA